MYHIVIHFHVYIIQPITELQPLCNLVTFNNKAPALGPLYHDGFIYHQTSSINRTLGNKLVDHTDVIGASAMLQLHLHYRLNTCLQ